MAYVQRFYKSKLLSKNSWLAIVRPYWEVQSSNKKDYYTVVGEEKGFTCECLGFSRWGKCKHIQYIEAKLQLQLDWNIPIGGIV